MTRLGLLFVITMLCSGCASAIYKGGRFHDVLLHGTSRVEIRRAMGGPVESGEERIFGINLYDDFVVRGPVYDAIRSAGAAIPTGMTLGLSELIAGPQALGGSLIVNGH